MKRTINHETLRAGGPSPHEHPSLHGSAASPGLPNLAGAQMPGPGVGRVLRGEDGRLTDAAADPWEWRGHLGRVGWLSRMLRPAKP